MLNGAISFVEVDHVSYLLYIRLKPPKGSTLLWQISMMMSSNITFVSIGSYFSSSGYHYSDDF